MAVPAQPESKFTLFPLFCSIQALNRVDDATRIGEGDGLYSVSQSLPESLLETSSETHPKIMYLGIP